MKVLVLRFSSIGDIVLASPVFRALHHQLPEQSKVHFLCKEQFAGINEHNPYISKQWTFAKDPLEVIEELRKVGFDHIIDLQNNYRSNRFSRKLSAVTHRLNKLNIKKWLLVRVGVDLLPTVHIVDRYMNTLSSLEVQKDEKGLDYFFPPGFGLSDEIKSKVNKRFVLFALGGAHEGKRLLSKQWAGIALRSDLQIVLVGGEADVQQAREVVNGSQGNVLNLCGKVSLHESAFLTSKAEAVVSGDTGMMHIATAMGAKVISLWGCTVPKFGMYPYKAHPQSVIVEPKDRSRRPCSKLGNRCKYGMSNKCISAINAGEIAGILNEVIAPR